MKRTPHAALDAFSKGYFQALIFTNLPDHLYRPGDIREWYDFRRTWDRMPARCQAALIQDCQRFQADNAQHLTEYPADDAGADFWYTRCGHGCGFWEEDHGTPEQCAALTPAARAAGEIWPEWYKGRLYYHPNSYTTKEPTA